jgi:pyruvate dehydrogenase E2 component (dihydrolipoamide acetyltransferase)
MLDCLIEVNDCSGFAGRCSAAPRREVTVFVFKLPDLGEGIHEGEIVKWYVQVGDVIKEDDPLVDVETD